MNGTDLLDLQIDERQLKELQRIFADAPKNIPKVMYRAINRSLTTMRSRIVKIAAKRLGVKAKIVRKRTWIRKANRKQLFGRIRTGAWGWPYMDFDAQQVATGVRVKMRRREVLESAFIAIMPSGHESVFKRAGSQPLPIRKQLTYGPSRAIREVGGEPAIRAAGAEMLTKRVAAETERLLKGKRK